jgi:glycosyltransferase involved in cell wall biosynthesis
VMDGIDGRKVAVLIPCYNEAVTVGKVVADFRMALPAALVYVYDNNSTDSTSAMAVAAGAIVQTEPLQGKGEVVRRMFADVEADIYVLVDGDDTYDAQAAPSMIEVLLRNNLDMVTGTREHESNQAYRPGHQFGNSMLTGAVRLSFGARITDMLSGYRVFSRRFVKSFPSLSSGFEIETEFTVHALNLRLPIGEVVTRYGVRPTGSQSKLHTVRDGVRVARAILRLVKEERPLQFFGAAALMLLLMSLAFGVPLISEFLETGFVPRFPTAIVAASLGLLSCLMLVAGLILDSVAHGRREMKRLAYLSLPSPNIQSATASVHS